MITLLPKFDTFWRKIYEDHFSPKNLDIQIFFKIDTENKRKSWKYHYFKFSFTARSLLEIKAT